MKEALDADSNLVYKKLQIDLDVLHSDAPQLQNVLRDVAAGVTNETKFDDRFGFNRAVNPSKCCACQPDNDFEVYAFAAINPPGKFYLSLCGDCAEGIAEKLEDYIEENTGELLAENL